MTIPSPAPTAVQVEAKHVKVGDLLVDPGGSEIEITGTSNSGGERPFVQLGYRDPSGFLVWRSCPPGTVVTILPGEWGRLWLALYGPQDAPRRTAVAA